MEVNRRRRGPSYPASVQLRVRKLYQVKGEAPTAIVRLMAEDEKDPVKVPLDTVKNWLRGLERGIGSAMDSESLTVDSINGWLQEPGRVKESAATGKERWNPLAATPEEWRLIAPLFALWETEEARHPAMMWPSQDVGDWFIRIRQLVPDHPVREIWMSARYLAMVQRRIQDGTGSDDDAWAYRVEIAEWLDIAGSSQRAEVAITVDLGRETEARD